jgi:hypothetical protein
MAVPWSGCSCICIMHNTLSTQLLNSADEGCRMRPFRLNAFLFSAGLGDGFHDDLYDFIDFYYF